MRLGEDDFLLDHLGGGFDLLVFGDSLSADVREAVQRWRGQGLKLRVLCVGPSAPVTGADATLADSAGRARARYGVRTDGAAYLLRPDQHVCARWMTLDAHRLNAALTQATTGVAA